MLRKTLDGGLRGFTYLSAILLSASTILSLINVITRSFLSFSTPWIEEISCYFVAIMMFIMIPVLEYKDDQLTISFLDEMLRKVPVARKIIFVFRGLVTIFFYVLLVKAGFSVVARNFEIVSATPILHIPYGWLYTIETGAFILVIVYWAFHFFLKDWGDKKK